MFKDIQPHEIDQVMDQSRVAFHRFKMVTSLQRSELLENIAIEIEGLGSELIRVAMEETNLPEARLTGERARTCNQLRQFAALIREGSWVDARIDTAIPDRSPAPKPDLRKMLVPLGPVVVFGASNFPLAYSTAGVDTASALAAGCPVVLKAHPAHAGTSEMVAGAIARAIEKTNAPKDVFQHVHGSSFDTGKLFVQHPATKAVGFTGSFSGGKALYDYASQRPEPIPVFAEMGSINPVFILPGALKARNENIATQLSSSITQNGGQFCTKPGLMVGVQNEQLDQFTGNLDMKVKKIDPIALLHPGIVSNFKKNRTKALGQKGVTLVAESDTKAGDQQGAATFASVSNMDFINNPVLFEEVFGPYSLLVKASSIEELKAAAIKLPGQLTVTIIGEVDELVENADLVQLLTERAGRVIINGVPTGVEVCPSMHHGGPFPATTDARFTSVGIDAIKRYARPVCFQNFPEALLPRELHLSNPLRIWRMFNGEFGNR